MQALKLQVPQDIAPSTAAAAITAVLHVLLLAAILINHTHVRPGRRETILILPIAILHPPAAEHERAKPPRRRGVTEAHIRPAILPLNAISQAPLLALHGLLFDCTAGNIAAMSEEDRARCDTVTGAPEENPSAEVTNHPSRAKDHIRWARALARKQAPALLPCASPQAAIITPYTLICLGKGVIEGFDLDAQPGYSDKPEEVFHLPNNGDPKPLRQPMRD